MLFGCAAGFEDYPLVSEAGYDYIELPCRKITALSREEFTKVRKTIEKGPIPCKAMNLYCPPHVVMAGPGFSLDTITAYAKDAAGKAEALGVANMGIGSPRSRHLPEGFSPDLARKQLIDFLKATADIFGSHNITVCLEALGPCYCNFVNLLSEAVDIVAGIRHEMLKVVLDLYNMEHSGDVALDYAYALPYLNHAHTSDDENDPSKRSYLREDKWEIHKERLSKLAGYGYGKTLTLEIDVPVDVEKARKSLACMRQSF